MIQQCSRMPIRQEAVTEFRVIFTNHRGTTGSKMYGGVQNEYPLQTLELSQPTAQAIRASPGSRIGVSVRSFRAATRSMHL